MVQKLVIVTVGALAWMWWELSGGSDFRPMSEIVAQAGDAAPLQTAEAPATEPQPDEVVSRAAVTPASLPVLPATVETVVEYAPLPTVTEPSSDIAPKRIAVADTPAGSTGFIEDEKVVEIVRIATQTPPADLRQVAGSRVNMRAGPGTAHVVIATLSRGDAVEVIDTNGAGWLQLRAVDLDEVGWMAERLVTAD